MGGVPTARAQSAIAAAVQELSPRRVNFVCVNVGPKYPMEYVAILQNMIARNVTNMENPCAFWCVTDRAHELPEGVYPIAHDPALPGWWQKVRLFSPEMPWAHGDRCVYFDLDVAITGRLEDLCERKGIAKDYGWPTYNSSLMVWDHGEHREIWDRFTPDIIDRSPGPLVSPDLLPKHVPNGGDQEWITEIGGWDLFPDEWCVSYRWQAKNWPPAEAKVVQFHGDPKPADVTDGWVPNVWKIGGFTSLPEMKGVNTSEDLRLSNVRINSERDLPWFTTFREQERTCVVCCGAPSMKDHLADIRAHQKRGAKIVSVNNSWRLLLASGVNPDVHVMLDARPENVEFVKGAPKSLRFLLASQCHPAVFDALQGYDVGVWHNNFDNGAEKLREILDPWWNEGPNQRPCILVPGGSTVGLRCLWLAAYSGYRTIHVYGMDSSYAEDGTHHAYAQGLNDGETVIDVVMAAKRYRAALWMVRQAHEFQQTWKDLLEYEAEPGVKRPVNVFVHGTGLVPDIYRALRAELMERA